MSDTQEGPIPPDKFAFAGKCERISRRQVWQLVNALWKSPNRKISLDLLAGPLWGNSKHDISIIALGSIRQASNRFFTKHEMPFRVRLKQEEAFLVDERTVTKK